MNEAEALKFISKHGVVEASILIDGGVIGIFWDNDGFYCHFCEKGNVLFYHRITIFDSQMSLCDALVEACGGREPIRRAKIVLRSIKEMVDYILNSKFCDRYDQ